MMAMSGRMCVIMAMVMIVTGMIIAVVMVSIMLVVVAMNATAMPRLVGAGTCNAVGV